MANIPVETSPCEYKRGRLMDVYGPPSGAAVLLWHGRGAYERTVMAPLALELAARHARVYVPGWDATAFDAGRSDLVASLRFVGESAAGTTLVGWSLAGTAAVSAAIQGSGDG